MYMEPLFTAHFKNIVTGNLPFPPHVETIFSLFSSFPSTDMCMKEAQ